MAKHKQKLKHVHCQGNPAGVKPGAIVAPSVDGAPILTLFEKAMDLVQGGADLQAAAVIGSDPSDTSETEQSNGLSFTAGTAKIKAIKFTSPSSIKVGGSDGSAYTWTVDATGHTLSGHLGGPSGAVAIILNLSGLFRVAPGGTLQPTITATLTDAFSHADGNLDNDIRISGIHVTAIDNNNKKATGAVTVHVVDDLPTLTVDAISAGALNSPNLNFNSLNLNVDETDAVAGSDRYAPGESQDDMNPDGNAGAAGLGQVTSNVVGGLASLFTIGGVAGADGATDSHALSFVFAGGATSLATTLSATDSGAIHLELSSSTSIAGVDGQGDTVFTIEIVETPASSGVFQLRLTLNEAIEHSDNARFDEVAYLLLSGQGAAVQLQLAVTRTDGDNDVVTVSDHIDLITNTDTFLTFDDDGPSAQAGTGIASAVLDESLASPDGDGDGINPATISATTIASLFASVGSDGPLAFSYKLSATDGAQTNLWLTGQSGAGSEILLNVVSDTVVEGRVGGAGALAFTIEINPTTGEVTITQAATFEHTVDDLTPEAHDDALTLGAAVNVVQHVTDGDGDSSEVTSATSLQVTFQDDGPTAHNDGSSADRLVQREDTAATIDAFANDHLGADGGDFDNVVFTQGARGSVTYDPTTNLFTYTPNPAVGGIDFFTYTIQDGDGDTSTATVFVDVDSKPQVGVPQNLVVDEDGLVGHNVDGNPVLRPGETDSTESATQTGSVVVDYIHDQPLPADLPGSIELLDTDSLDNQLQTLAGTDVVFALEGGKLVGRPLGGGNPVVTIEFTGFVDDPGNLVTYNYQATLNQPVKHAGAGEDTVILSDVSFKVTDADGSSGFGFFSVTIVDDAPIISVSAADSLTVDETNLAANASANFADNFAASYGADGAGTTTYALNVSSAGVDSGLDDTATGSNILLFKEGNTIVGRVGSAAGAVSFIVGVDTNGNVSLDQQRAILHTPNSGPDQDATLTAANLISLTATITDRDGDTTSDSINIGTALHFHDDAPAAIVANAVHAPIVLDETRPVGTETDGNSAPAGLVSVTAAFASNFAAPNYGSDGAGLGAATFSLLLTGTNVNSGLYALDPLDTTASDGDGIGRGAQIVLNQSGSTITGSLGVTPYFTISINPNTGDVTFAQSANIWHANTGSDDDASTLTLAAANLLQVVQTVTDADGDTGFAAVNVGTGVFQIEDDGPTAANITRTINEGAAPITGNLLTDGPGSFGTDSGYVKSVTANATTYTYNPATDAITFAGGPNNGSFNSATNVLTIALTSGASFTIDIDDGSYSYTAPPAVGANISEPLGFTLADRDGDTQSATLTVNVNNVDQAPIVANDHVITNYESLIGSGIDPDQIVIPHYALLHNDTDPDGQAISVTAAVATSDFASASFNTPPGSVTATEESDTAIDGGTFTYTGTAGALSDTGLVTVSRPSTSPGLLTGTGSGEILLGNSGADTLRGGGGSDVLIGRGGDDIFDFNSLSDSPTLAQADLIGDFEGAFFFGGDIIDLRTIDANTAVFDNQAFTFVDVATSNVFAHKVTWFQDVANNRTIIQADVNGNTTADLVITVRGLHILSGFDFFL